MRRASGDVAQVAIVSVLAGAKICFRNTNAVVVAFLGATCDYSMRTTGIKIRV
jgi:hypothetical protein